MMYIAFEGVVGTGKSTQSRLLVERLREQYPDRRVELVREPGGTEISEAIRTLVQATEFGTQMHPRTDAYLYAAARAELLHGYVAPLLDEGAIIVSDRTFVSSLAIQGQAQGLGLETVRAINEQAVQGMLPDLIIGMDMPIEIGYDRAYDPAGDKFETRPLSFYEQIELGYLTAAQDTRLRDRRVRVDAIGSIDEVTSRIHDVIEQRFDLLHDQDG